jgi:hypothetical protein
MAIEFLCVPAGLAAGLLVLAGSAARSAVSVVSAGLAAANWYTPCALVGF